MEKLVRPLKVKNETEKAVSVEVLGIRPDGEEHYTRVWLPLKCVVIQEEPDGKWVTEIEGWLAEKRRQEAPPSYSTHCSGNFNRDHYLPENFDTHEYLEAIEARFENGKKRYERLVEAAKAAGLPIRNRMKTATILKIAKENNVTLNY
jgi:hypothetical protein